ncbi:MAG: DUF4406 domain-containing protein [Treponema sp.]|jgi:hypothetical protein|nr:DUF4406 domain-containing protein [Treponema sp.]
MAYRVTGIYIAGKVTGDPDYKEKFLEAENKLFDAGFEPLNPTSLILSNCEWKEAMRIAIRLMLKGDGVALLKDWKCSKGAKIEVKIARMVGIPVKRLETWLGKKPKYPRRNI